MQYNTTRNGGLGMIIGICGKSGSGKSTLSKKIVEYYKNAIYLDIDKIGHKVLTIDKVKEELINAFGKEIIEDERINRKRLGELVFNSRNQMKKLSDITWHYMQKEIDSIIKSNKNKLIILDWILLPTTSYFDKCNIKILLDVPYEIRKERACVRDNITEEEFYLREKASIDLNSKDFDYVLSNITDEIIRKLVKNI